MNPIPSGPFATRVVFCGDREVSAHLVELMASDGGNIVGLGLNCPPGRAAGKITEAAGLEADLVFYGRSIGSEVALRKLRGQAPDLGVCCGFAPILSAAVLALPRWGWVNLHRSYLPYNRGLDPLQWAVVDGTPVGVTLHVMTDRVDAGDILGQAEMPVYPTDNMDSLEARADELVFEVFRTAWPTLRTGNLHGRPQDEDLATYHDLADCDALRRLDRNATMKVGRLLDILRCYSGATYSAVHFRSGLLRSPFTVHTDIRLASEHGDEAEPAGSEDAHKELQTQESLLLAVELPENGSGVGHELSNEH